MTVRDALNSAMDEEMARDPDVFILGEEVRRFDWLKHSTKFVRPHCLTQQGLLAGGRIPGRLQGVRYATVV